MQPTEIVYFSVMLFVALAVLIAWKRRQDVNAARLNRGLRGYVAAKNLRLARPDETHGENLIPV